MIRPSPIAAVATRLRGDKRASLTIVSAGTPAAWKTTRQGPQDRTGDVGAKGQIWVRCVAERSRKDDSGKKHGAEREEARYSIAPEYSATQKHIDRDENRD